MSVSKSKLQAQANKLRNQLATAEATVDDLRAKLAKIEAQLTGAPAPVTGLDLLWEAAPESGRNRSSKLKCRVAWNKVPKAERPSTEKLVEAMKTWSRCPEWKKDGGQFVLAVDRWIKEQRWESLPEAPNPMARYQNLPKPAPAPVAAADVITNRDEVRGMLGLKPLNKSTP